MKAITVLALLVLTLVFANLEGAPPTADFPVISQNSEDSKNLIRNQIELSSGMQSEGFEDYAEGLSRTLSAFDPATQARILERVEVNKPQKEEKTLLLSFLF